MKTTLKFYALIPLMLNAFCLLGQTERIDTILINEKHIGQGNLVATTPFSTFRPDDEDKDKYVGMPTQMDSFRLDFLPFDVQQFYYDRLKRGKISYAEILKRTRSGMDTSVLSKDFIKYRVGVFSGIKGNIKTIILDANNNLDFSDDRVLKFDTAYQPKGNLRDFVDSLPTVEVKFEVFNGGKIQTKTKSVKVFPFSKGYSNTSKLDNYYVQNDYNVGVSNFYCFEMDKGRNDVFIVTLDSMKSRFLSRENHTYTIDEKFIANSNIYSIHKISRLKDTLFLKHWGKGNYVEGHRKGMKAFPFCQQTIENAPICLEKLRGKYVLLDFGGTWCKPCIASIPDLKKIRDGFTNNELEIISVAKDDNLGKVKEYIQRYEMNWTHLQEANSSSGDTNAMTTIFKVNVYPTTILIDKNGYIIERGSGTEFVEKLYDKLKVVLK
jgi:thiol-disulfide isomerase/thioredoxin